VDYVDISPKQIVGVSAALIPFLEHDDANRALMGSNMQRQAVPLIKVDPPCVATGMEWSVREEQRHGRPRQERRHGHLRGRRAHHHRQLRRVRAAQVRRAQRADVPEPEADREVGQKVEEGQISPTAPPRSGELAMGKNALVAFNTFDGYNFEDAIVISERLVKDDTFTSIHIDSFDVEIRETKLGREEFTRDIPNVSEKMLRNLDEHGIIRSAPASARATSWSARSAPRARAS
jgi:DNA-directed RNA polymerase subunit beta